MLASLDHRRSQEDHQFGLGGSVVAVGEEVADDGNLGDARYGVVCVVAVTSCMRPPSTAMSPSLTLISDSISRVWISGTRLGMVRDVRIRVALGAL
jgi:hypothetical protein